MPPTPQDRKPRKTTSRRTAAQRIEVGSTEDKYTATAWGSDLGQAKDLEMPSGQLALVKRPGVEGLVKTGVLNDLDSLTAMVESKHMGKGANPEAAAKELMQDTSAVDSLLHAVDRVVCSVVVKPEVKMAPNDVTLRRDGVIYTDMIDLVDKMFIFNYAIGNVADLERFRQQAAGSMGSLESQ